MREFIAHLVDYLRDIFVIRLCTFSVAIRWSLFMILFSAVAIVELYFFISIRRRLLAYQLKRDRAWRSKFSNILGNMIVYGENESNEAIVQHFLPRFERMSISRGSVRRILVQELLNYRENFSGNTSQVLRDIYLGLNLDRYPKRRLRRRFAKDKIAAIRELSQMQVPGLVDTMLAYAGSNDDSVSVEAYAALLKLDKVKPLGILNNIQQPISDWAQIMLFDAITKTPGINIPPFSAWLSSANDSVVRLCLKLIAHFQQLDAIPQILGLLHHKNTDIRLWAVRVLGKLENPICEDSLVAIYPKEHLMVKIEILDALSKISSGAQIQFIRSCTSAPEFEIRNKAKQMLQAYYREEDHARNLVADYHQTLASAGILHQV